MPEFAPSLLAEWTGGVWRGPSPAGLTGFAIDSRVIRPGQLFVAILSGARDGHAFVNAAGQAGAGGALVARHAPEVAIPQLVVADPVAALQTIARRHRERFPGPVIGVTGSAGKTSTKDLLALALGGREQVLATEGNLNNLLGVPLTLLGIDPDRHRFAVVEAGISENGEMDQLAAMIQPDAAVITTVAPAHLELLETVENVGHEKTRLFHHLRRNGRAYFPIECLRWKAFQVLACPSTLIVSDSSDPAGEDASPHSVFRFRSVADQSGRILEAGTATGPSVRFRLGSTSPGMASNAALSLAVAIALGVEPGVAASRLEAWRPLALRGEILEQAGRFVYLDCYNANPASMLDAAHAFVERVDPADARLYVLGSMEELGTRSSDLHVEVGRAWPVGRNDRFVLIGEQGEALRKGLLEAGSDPETITLADRHAAIRSLIDGWTGAIFLKGSRRHHLEGLIESIRSETTGREAAC